MRSLTFTMRRDEGFHPASRRLIEQNDVTRERLYHLNILDDGTCVLLIRLRGDLAEVEQLARNRPDVLSFRISEYEQGHGLAFVHTQPPHVIEEFMQVPQEHEVFFDFPWRGSVNTGSA